MARVFISHAHGDEALARRIAALLRDALNLDPTEFFLSSQGGRGVAPAANIREEIFSTLSEVPALVVLVTPQSAGRPWVWLEAGHRLGRPDRSNPLFLVPSERHVGLLQPVADLRCIRLDDDDDLIELVNAVGANVGETPADVLSYKPALDELAHASRTAYSTAGERWATTSLWLRRYAPALAIALVAMVGGLYAWSAIGAANRAAEDANRAAEEARQHAAKLESDLSGANDVVNEEVSRTAARYLQLKGVVTWRDEPIEGARVVASLKTAADGCGPPDCVADETTSDGRFLLDLTKIGAIKDDEILLRVTAPDFDAFSRRVKLDVRAIDVAVPAHIVALTRARPGGP